MSEKLILTTNETAHWYAVLSVIQANQKCILPIEVESYLVRLFVNVFDSIESSLKETLVSKTPIKEWNSAELKRYADHCLLVTGLYPEFLVEFNIPIQEMVTRGTAAYKELIDRQQADEPYAYFSDNFDLLSLILLQIHAMDRPELKSYMDEVDFEKLGIANQTLQKLSSQEVQNISFN